MLASVSLALINVDKIVDKIESSIALAAFVGIVLLLPLVLSQRRDIKRLTAFHEREPGYPRADFAASEALLARAETELEEIYAERGVPITGDAPAAAATEVHPSGLRFGDTTELPALDRRTIELAALERHPRWKRIRDQLTRPAWLAAIAVGAALIAGAVVISSENVGLDNDDQPPSTTATGFTPSAITVAVLNGTSADGLASEVSSEISDAQYTIGQITHLSGAGSFPTTVVYFQPKDPLSEKAAGKVAKLLGGDTKVQEITPQAQKLAADADVVVVAGDDRAG